MIISRLQGGLGNQMFQYALGRVLSLKNNAELGLDTTYLLDRTPIPNFTFRDYDLDVFNIQAKVVDRFEIPYLYRKYELGVFMRYIDYFRRKILSTPGKEKKAYFFDEKILDTGPDVYLEGWWQSPKYFVGYEDVIRKDFTLKKVQAKNILDLALEIRSGDSLCIHIRRGDYVGNSMHELVNMDYYLQGIEYIKNKSKIDKIYVFSDDTEWCKENLHFDIPIFCVGDEYLGDKNSGHLFLMSQCHNFIIANSSFSWWGAWLSDYKDKIVVCPKQWIGDSSIDTSDLIPENWIRI